MRFVGILLLLVMAACEAGSVVQPASLVVQVVDGNGQDGEVAQPLAEDLSVRVLDGNGVPAAGVPVTWSALAGELAHSSTSTGPDGVARNQWRLGTAAGAQHASASVAGGARAEFHATAAPGPAVRVRLKGDSVFEALAGSTSTDLFLIEDAFGNAVPLVAGAVQWTSSNPAVADVQGDGAIVARRVGNAIVTASFAATMAKLTVIVYRQLFSDASTGLPEHVRTTGRTMEARAGDFDGDGDLDLILAKEHAVNVLLINDGSGRFTDGSSRIPLNKRDSEDIAVGDFDGDGDLDIVIVSEDDRLHEYYLNDGSGNFEDVSSRIPVSSEANAVAAGDIDADGDLDLILGGAGPEIILINSRGFFTNESASRVPAVNAVSQDVALGDVDGDGDLDLLVGNEGSGNRLYFNDGHGFFTAAPAANLPGSSVPEVTRNADFGDADGDGDLDIFFANATLNGGHPQDRLLINDGKGFFRDETARRLGGVTHSTLDGDFVDVDADGDLDIVAATFPPGANAQIYVNDGTGHFRNLTTRLLPVSSVGGMIEVEAADFDRDGVVDLFFAAYNDANRLLLGVTQPSHAERFDGWCREARRCFYFTDFSGRPSVTRATRSISLSMSTAYFGEHK